jgi:hypothetical protein
MIAPRFRNGRLERTLRCRWDLLVGVGADLEILVDGREGDAIRGFVDAVDGWVAAELGFFELRGSISRTRSTRDIPGSDPIGRGE